MPGNEREPDDSPPANRVEPPYPGPRRPVLPRIALIASVLILLCGGAAVWVLVHDASTGPAAGRIPQHSTFAPSTPAAPRSPRAGDPPIVRVAWIRGQVDTALAVQAAALLRGDESAFLATGEPGNAAVRNDLTRRFRALRAMRVTRWEPRAAAAPDEGGAGASAGGASLQWSVKLAVRHCFVVPDCAPDDMQVDSRWVEREGRTYLAELGATGSDQNGPRPWEVADLRVGIGKRAVIATTVGYASRLPALLKDAEQAATVADRYVVGDAPPDRYYMYFAGSAEWKQWYGGSRPDWAAGYAVPVSDKRIDVVLNAAQTPTNFIDDIMRHEVSHAASLRGLTHQDSADWWLIEGMAEQAEMNGRPARQHDAVAAGAVRTFVRSGKWNGSVSVGEPPAGAELYEAGAHYGVAFLAVRAIAERYGEPKLLVFFRAVVHEDKTLEVASQEAFGAQWTDVEAACVDYIRRIAG